MSAGHGHKRPNLQRPDRLKELLTTRGAPALMKRWQKIDVDHDIPDLAGYNVAGTVRYLDRDFFHALLDPNYAAHLGIGPINTGLSPEDTIECLLTHEGDEKVIMDADNDVDIYERAHEYGTLGEHEKVREKNGRPVQYERGLAKAIKFCEHKHISNPPVDLACAPYLDEPDAADLKALSQFRDHGVEDAFKESKEDVQYSESTGKDRCDGCAFWLEDPEQKPFGLARCQRISGLVRDKYWCVRFRAQEGQNGQANRMPVASAPPIQPQEETGGEANEGLQSGGPQGQVAPGAGNPGGSENTNGAAGGGQALEEPGNQT